MLSSGPEPAPPAPPGSLRRLLARVRAAVRRGPAARRLVVAVAVLAALGGLAALRSGAGPPAGGPDDDRPVAGPVGGGVAGEPDRADLPGAPRPPYDRLPGRVPIPPPTHAGWFVRGTLPPTGQLGRPAALRAAQLVLGRYCARPDRYTITFDPAADWRRVDALVFGLDRSGDPPAVQLQLTWTGRSFAWSGTAVQLNAC